MHSYFEFEIMSVSFKTIRIWVCYTEEFIILNSLLYFLYMLQNIYKWVWVCNYEYVFENIFLLGVWK